LAGVKYPGCAGAVKKALSLREADQFQGAIGLGGSMGITLGTAVRTSLEEMVQLADRMIDICGFAQGPVAISIPTGGFSAFGSENGPLRDPDGDKAFYQRLLARLPRHVRVDHLPYDVNHPEFAKLVRWRFLKISGRPG
jgi:uncharacterized protein (UPF0261 family)